PNPAAPTRVAGMAGLRDHDLRRPAQPRRDRRQRRRRPTRSDALARDLLLRLHLLRRARPQLRGHGMADTPQRSTGRQRPAAAPLLTSCPICCPSSGGPM
ncbi:MAG: hypothetical protein AVDCRST_MAG67-3561, partial [uncultured Solirubrobacteraceae bacterium]